MKNNLIFSDEFSGSALDVSKWNTSYFWDNYGSTNAGNNELEWYLPQNVSVNNGVLSLTAKREDHQGSDGKTYPYTSGIVTSDTKFSFLYGYAEMKAKIPKGKGLWPAFWLLPADHSWPPEIDVMEVLGDNPAKVYCSVHYYKSGIQVSQAQGNYIGPDLSQDFHVYGVEWRPGALTWYLDGVKIFQCTTRKYIPNKPMYILANLAVGGTWPGSPDAQTIFPSVFQIEYIKVWS